MMSPRRAPTRRPSSGGARHEPRLRAILPPHLHDRARAWQRHMADHGFAGLHLKTWMRGIVRSVPGAPTS